MPRVRPISAAKLIKVLKKVGFQEIRQTGSHIILMNDKGIRTVIPNHPGKDVKPSLVRAIIRESGLTRDEFFALLEEV